MSQPPEESPDAVVYRRIAPPQFKIKRNVVDADAFLPAPGMKGLSVFHADKTKPHDVLQARLDEAAKLLRHEEETVRAKAQRFLSNNPDVSSLVSQGQYRIVEIPVAEIRAMGFDLEEPDDTGHLNILGESDLFLQKQYDFVELINTGKARILTAEECLE